MRSFEEVLAILEDIKPYKDLSTPCQNKIINLFYGIIRFFIKCDKKEDKHFERTKKEYEHDEKQIDNLMDNLSINDLEYYSKNFQSFIDNQKDSISNPRIISEYIFRYPFKLILLLFLLPLMFAIISGSASQATPCISDDISLNLLKQFINCFKIIFFKCNYLFYR